ncbi:MAG TPA: hypothetical protein VJ781_07870 [Pyrinomonadaceae bacterium]|nr:hypothetical protein [Pyrinomonadaceae bacterium]
MKRPTTSVHIRFRVYLLVLFCVLVSFLNVAAQVPDSTPEPQPSNVEGAEEDPTKPIGFSIRNEYKNLRNGAWANGIIFRFDHVALKQLQNPGGLKGVILRFDVPWNTVHVGTRTETGLGDIYVQAIYVPRASRGFSFAVGSGFVLPTATNDLLGTGKLILAPTAVPIWNFPKSRRRLLIRFQNFFSVAGKSSRPDINYFVAAPALIGRLHGKWWYTADTELRWHWRAGLGSGISGFLVGRLVKGKFGIAFKPEIPWGPGRAGDFNLKFAVFKIR